MQEFASRTRRHSPHTLILSHLLNSCIYIGSYKSVFSHTGKWGEFLFSWLPNRNRNTCGNWDLQFGINKLKGGKEKKKMSAIVGLTLEIKMWKVGDSLCR